MHTFINSDSIYRRTLILPYLFDSNINRVHSNNSSSQIPKLSKVMNINLLKVCEP